MFTFLLLLVGFILLKFETNIAETYKKTADKQTCKASVQTHAALKMKYADFSGDIKCPTVKVTINDKDENVIKKQIADSMYDCWDQFGRGKLELFSDDSEYCTICHRISLDKNIKVNGFTDYLAKTNAPRQKISYLQFMTTEKTQSSDFLNDKANKKVDDTIDASKNGEYAVIFTYIKGRTNLKQFVTKATYATPGLGTIAIGFGIFKLGGIVGAGLSTIATPAVGVPVGVTISSAGALTMGVGVLWSFLAVKFADAPFEHISLISFIPYDAPNLQNLNCKEIPVKQ